MKFQIGVSELTKALSRVQGIVEKKTTMPHLANVLIEASDDNRIKVSATNLELGLVGHYPAEVRTPGSIQLAGRALFEIVRSLPHASLTLEKAANNWVEIASGKVSFKVVGSAAEGFPALPRFEEVPFFNIDPAVFREMIDRTLFSVSTDETRYNLTGVYVEPTGTGLRMVSTDGHRLSLVERAVEEKVPLKKGVIVPRKGVIELRKLLDDAGGPARIGFVENSAVFERGEIVLTTQLLEGQFPDYQQVIPSSFSRKAYVEREAFREALKRTSLLASDKSQSVRVDLRPGVLTLSANNPDLGEASEEIEVEFDGEPLRVGFNFRYLLDVLTVLPEGKVELSVSDALSPGLLRSEKAPDFRAIVMPMRL
ncbi:MAG: DNA polymerase III subunit beta [Deltaproteobacteria bacterium]|nr:DNA polymerase III subunit beta [Deltaproteobacteria bacterium]